MFIDIIISLFLAAVIAAILGVAIYVFIKHPEILVMVIFVTIILVGLVVAPSVAEPAVEHVVLTDYEVSPDIFDGEPVLRVDFKYHTNWLSLYWETNLDTSRYLIVEVYNEVECIDAYYAQ